MSRCELEKLSRELPVWRDRLEPPQRPWAHSVVISFAMDCAALWLKERDELDRLRAERDLLRAEVRAWRDYESTGVAESHEVLRQARADVDAFDKEATGSAAPDL